MTYEWKPKLTLHLTTSQTIFIYIMARRWIFTLWRVILIVIYYNMIMTTQIIRDYSSNECVHVRWNDNDCDVHGSFGRTLTIAPRGLQTLFQGKRVSSATAGSRGDGRASYDAMHAGHRNPLELDLELKTVIGTIDNHKTANVHTSTLKMNTNGCLRLKYYVNAQEKCCS